MSTSKSLLFDLLNIPSPTYSEHAKCDFIMNWLSEHMPVLSISRLGNNLIATNKRSEKTHLAFVGHIDTVPEFFTPYEDNGRIYGSGASDMQAGIASMLSFILENQQQLLNKYDLSIIIYDKEEGTPLHENGLNELIQEKSSFLKSIDVAILGEPTDNAVQVGCVGSIHYEVNVMGKAAHSARPWHGENALYKALPLINKIASLDPKLQNIFGVDFYDVLSITESQSSPGKTTVPDIWTGNLNYRFSPTHSLDDAINYVETIVKDIDSTYQLTRLSAVNAGKVIEHPILESFKKTFKCEAKQAWTDVAQLTDLGICAFNFGPGHQAQAHRPDEYVYYDDMIKYEKQLHQGLLEES